MKHFAWFSLLCVSLYGEIDYKGHFDFDAEFYPTRESGRSANTFTFKQTLELSYKKDDWEVFSKIYAQEAYDDLLKENKQTQRTFARVDELYYKKDTDSSSFSIGKSIRFWGSLELRNIVDGFNPNELRDDMFSNNKLGVYNASYSYFTQNGEISAIVKVHEQDLKMAQYPYVYFFFPKNISYEQNLQTSTSPNRASLYLKVSGSTDTEYALDYAFIYENGYDSQRYFTTVLNQPARFVQNAYLVNKFMTYETLVIGSTLLKLEALYADVENGVLVGDYSHTAFGFEHTFDELESGGAIGLIGEYYKYKTYEASKLNDLQLYETLQDDLFIGFRYSANDVDDTSLVGGVVHDFEYDEQTYYAKFEKRIGKSVKLELDYYYIEPSKTTQTAYALLGRHQRVGINIGYYF